MRLETYSGGLVRASFGLGRIHGRTAGMAGGAGGDHAIRGGSAAAPRRGVVSGGGWGRASPGEATTSGLTADRAVQVTASGARLLFRLPFAGQPLGPGDLFGGHHGLEAFQVPGDFRPAGPRPPSLGLRALAGHRLNWLDHDLDRARIAREERKLRAEPTGAAISGLRHSGYGGPVLFAGGRDYGGRLPGDVAGSPARRPSLPRRLKANFYPSAARIRNSARRVRAAGSCARVACGGDVMRVQAAIGSVLVGTLSFGPATAGFGRRIGHARFRRFGGRVRQ
jgi:hypothetical protein